MISPGANAAGAFVYPMVLAALPRHSDLFIAKRPPVTRLGLERRLRMLPLEDQAEIAAIEEVLDWKRARIHGEEAEALAWAKAVITRVRSAAVAELLADRIDFRAIMAALRRRARGEASPGNELAWPRGELGARIRRHWREADFRIGSGHAWVRRVEPLMRAGETLAVERTLFAEAWRRLARAALFYPQGYEAIVIYVMRWSLIHRWTQYRSDAAATRFDSWTYSAAKIAEAML